jgi:hypothetical protein
MATAEVTFHQFNRDPEDAVEKVGVGRSLSECKR